LTEKDTLLFLFLGNQKKLFTLRRTRTQNLKFFAPAEYQEYL